MEKKLFRMAEKYANEAENEENLARVASLAVQNHTSRAQIARNKMMRV